MKFTAAALVSLFSAAAVLANPIEAIVNSEMTFTGPAFPGAEPITLTGTADAIWAQILAINPSYESDFPPSPLEVRAAQAQPICDKWDSADVKQEYERVKYLRGLNGNCGVSTGPRACSRVSCAYNAAIYMCNDVSFYLLSILSTIPKK